MDDEDWVKVYMLWSVVDLIKEVGNCHRYQQDLLARAAQGLLTMDMGLRLMITSQTREYNIYKAIREIENGEKSNT